MCAIIGSININISRLNFSNALNTMHNRGPDSEGFFSDEVNNYKINFGHKRLSILDLNNGSQPMISYDKTIIVIYNGEIYNSPKLRQELSDKGYRFISKNSDTEVLIHGYKEWGENLPLYLDGMWSFAIFDKTNNKIFTSRDKLGEKPFFYYCKDKKFIFSSEISAFSKFENLDLSYNYNNLKKYCAYGFFPGDLTPYKYIKKLENGSNLIFNLNKFTFSVKKYWEYKIEPDYSHDEQYWKERLEFEIDRSVKDRLISDVPTGVFLSGGLDSSIITYHAKKYFNDNLKTFSIKFENKTFDETKYAQYISKLLQTTHNDKLLETTNIKSINNEYMKKMSEPLSDSSLLSFYQLCGLAKQKVTVALGGDGADELFGGYDTLKAINYAKFVSKFKINKFHPAINFFIKKLPSNNNYMNLKFKIQRFLKFLSTDIATANCQWLSPLNLDEISHIFNEKSNLDEIYSEAIEAWKKNDSLDDLDKSNEFYCKIFLPNQILVKTDRLSMMHSLELRSPFLSNEIIKISSTIPNKYKIKNNVSKYILKKIYEKKFGKDFTYRPKIGFSSPLSNWFKNRNIDLKFKSNLLINNKVLIDKKFKEHNLNIEENRIFFWNLLNLDNFLNK